MITRSLQSIAVGSLLILLTSCSPQTESHPLDRSEKLPIETDELASNSDAVTETPVNEVDLSVREAAKILSEIETMFKPGDQF